MNTIERQMLDILKELRNEFGIVAVKAEFEAEGSRTDELIMLNEIVFKADTRLIIKIGGCEAVRDMDQCRLLGASGIMAPMIETPFAMRKFIGAANKVYGDSLSDIEWIINTETKTCHDNLDSILKEGEGFLDTVTIGRDDLSASMGIDRDRINGEEVFEATQDIADRSKKAGYCSNFGGTITFEAIPFICSMYTYIDRFETRKVVFPAMKDQERLKQGILKAIEFETLYLKNKEAYYSRLSCEDASRIKLMTERLKAGGSKLVL